MVLSLVNYSCFVNLVCFIVSFKPRVARGKPLQSIAVDVADFRCFFTVLPCLYQSRLVNKTLKRFFLTCMKNYITCAMYCYFLNLCI